MWKFLASRSPEGALARAWLAATLTVVALAGSVEADEVQRVEIAAGSHYFRPDSVVVNRGVPVEIVIRNESFITPHNFVIDSPETGLSIRLRIVDEPSTFT